MKMPPGSKEPPLLNAGVTPIWSRPLFEMKSPFQYSAGRPSTRWAGVPPCCTVGGGRIDRVVRNRPAAVLPPREARPPATAYGPSRQLLGDCPARLSVAVRDVGEAARHLLTERGGNDGALVLVTGTRPDFVFPLR